MPVYKRPQELSTAPGGRFSDLDPWLSRSRVLDHYANKKSRTNYIEGNQIDGKFHELDACRPRSCCTNTSIWSLFSAAAAAALIKQHGHFMPLPIGETLSSTPFFGVWSSKWTVQGFAIPPLSICCYFRFKRKAPAQKKSHQIPSNVIGELPIKITGWLFDIMGSVHPAYMKLIIGTIFKLSEWVSTRLPVTFKLTFRQINGWLFAKPRHIDMWNLDFPHSTKEQKLPNMDRVLRASSLGWNLRIKEGEHCEEYCIHIYIIK